MVIKICNPIKLITYERRAQCEVYTTMAPWRDKKEIYITFCFPFHGPERKISYSDIGRNPSMVTCSDGQLCWVGNQFQALTNYMHQFQAENWTRSGGV
jgi:hypothetical protein